MTRRAYIALSTNAVYPAAALIAWPAAPVAACALALLGLASAWFHLSGSPRSRIADVACMWLVVGALVGGLWGAWQAAAVAAALAAYYLLGWAFGFAHRRVALWTGQDLPYAAGLYAACYAMRADYSGLPVLLAGLALVGAGYALRVASERAYDAACVPGADLPRDVAAFVPSSRLGLMADALHGAWHALTAPALALIALG